MLCPRRRSPPSGVGDCESSRLRKRQRDACRSDAPAPASRLAADRARCVTVLPTTTFWPSFSSTAWSTASTRTFFRIVSLMNFSTPVDLLRRLVAARQDHVDMVVRQDEAAGAGFRRHVHRYRAHAVRQDRGHEAAALGHRRPWSRGWARPPPSASATTAPTKSLIASGRSLFLTRAELADAAGQVCQPTSPSLITCPVLRSVLATRTSTSWPAAAAAAPGGRRGVCDTAREHGRNRTGRKRDHQTMMRERLIVTSVSHASKGGAQTGRRAGISSAKRQGMVNEAYPIALITRHAGICGPPDAKIGRACGRPALAADRRHPLGVRVDDQRRGRQRDAIGHAAIAAMQPLGPRQPRRTPSATACRGNR